jgi:site-specific DNA-methyltransferase (adenine-specific)
MQPDWISDDGAATLYCGDALRVLPTLTSGSVDTVVTDPPYGVDFRYATHDDNPIGYREWCNRWFDALKTRCTGPIAISCGIGNLSGWPQPDWVFCWHKPAAMGRCVVGFNNWEPLIVYGKTRAGQVVDVFTAPIVPDDSLKGHPCPKPIGWGRGAVARIAADGDTVLDPFMGSGTTGVACIQTGRRFIGIDIAKHRIIDAQREVSERFDFAKPAKMEQQMFHPRSSE